MHTFITVSHMWNQTVNTTQVISLSFNLQTFMPALERTRFQGYKTNRTGFCTQTLSRAVFIAQLDMFVGLEIINVVQGRGHLWTRGRSRDAHSHLTITRTL